MTLVRTLMSHELVTLTEEDGLIRALEIFAKHPIRHIPVVDGHKLVGVVSQRDALRWSGSALDPTRFVVERAEKKANETFVAEMMIRDVVTIGPEASVADAARAMLAGGFGCLPVVTQAGDLVGIITETDMLRHLITDELSAGQVHSPPPSQPQLRED